MGTLYDMSQTLMREIEARYSNPMDLIRAKGEVARVAGFMVSMVTVGDADDPQKLESLRAAAREFQISL